GTRQPGRSMSDALDRLLEEFSDVTAAARVTRPNPHNRRGSNLSTAIAASLVVLVVLGVGFVLLRSPSQTSLPAARTSPSASAPAEDAALFVENRGGPVLNVQIDGR